MKPLLTLILATFASCIQLSYAQKSYQIIDFHSGDPVPFVKILPDVDRPCLSDIDGRFTLFSDSNTRITLKSVAYSDSTYQLNLLSDGIIRFKTLTLQIEELTVKPGVNPAERIMALAIENRKKNNPTEDLDFTYDSYSKMVFQFDPSFMDTIPKNMEDTNFLSLSRLIDSMNLFMIESTSSRKFKAPARNKEIIQSYKVSGISDPMFATFFNNMQSFHFYENQFDILGNAYINPIAFGGINRYLFILKDTTLNPTGDTTYTITFRPRKGKNFNGMKGTLFINTNGFAIEKVIASPAIPDSTFALSIVQEYEFLEQQRWFPVKLSTELSLQKIEFKIGNHRPPMAGKGNTYIRNIKLNPPLTMRDFDQISIETAPGSDTKSDADWEKERLFELTQKERNTYAIIDSVAKENHLDRYLNAFKVLRTGKIPMGYVNLDLNRLMTYNGFEGFRLGAGLETSQKLMQRLRTGAYFAYGFMDQEWKYGAFTDLNLHRRKNCFLRADYAFDAFERAEAPFEIHKDRFSIYENTRRYYIRQMDYAQLASLGLRGYLVPRIQFQLFSSYRRIQFGDSYRFTPTDSSLLTPQKRFDVFEVGGEISWQFREQILQIGYERISMGSKFPVFHFKAVRGIKGSGEAAYDYWRLNTSISHTLKYMNYGKILWEIRAGMTLGSVPLFLSQTVPGTNGKTNISVPGTFETLAAAGMYADRFAAMFFRYQFPKINLNMKTCSPQISLHHAMGTGSMKNPAEHSIDFITMSKGYYEYGMVIDQLYTSNFSGFGIGVFNSYGPYAPLDWKKGIVTKLSFSLTF